MKKLILKVILISVIILMLIIVVFSFIKLKNNDTIKIAIYPSGGGLSETYYFEIKSNGKILVEKGDRTSNDLSKSNFMQRENPYKDEKNVIYDFESEKKRLSETEIDKIYDLVNKIYETNIPNFEGLIYDSWNIQILYQGETLIQNCYDQDYPQIHELIDELMLMSPITINLRDFA